MPDAPPDMVIRSARSEDADGIFALWSGLYRQHRRAAPDVIGDLISPRSMVDLLLDLCRGGERSLLVAERNEEIVGILQITLTTAREHPLLENRRFAVINDLVVSPRARLQGIGEALLEEAEEWAKERGVHEFEAEVYSFNEDAIAFYHDLGYEVVSRIVFKRE